MFIELLNYGFMQRALLGGVAISLICSLLGPFLVLRKLSLLGDGLAHVALGGIAIGLLLGVHPVAAALVATSIGSLLVYRLVRTTTIQLRRLALLGLDAPGLAPGEDQLCDQDGREQSPKTSRGHESSLLAATDTDGEHGKDSAAVWRGPAGARSGACGGSVRAFVPAHASGTPEEVRE